jgi:glycosyltransferase involved in cell wall biosynthesis
MTVRKLTDEQESNLLIERRAMEAYPRVLIVNMACLNQSDQHGVSLRNWFADWPKDRLAQIYSGADLGGEKFCGLTFQIGPAERRWGTLFFMLKRSSLGESSRPVIVQETADDPKAYSIKRIDFKALLRNRISRALILSGLWELLFPPRISPGLEQWVHEFKPQVIYCQGYSLAFTWLPLMLSRKFHVPVCFQTGDDWPEFLYRDSVVAWAVRPLVKRAVHNLITCASARFANGDLMADEYQVRYGHPFVPLMMGDNIERFRQAIPRRAVDTNNVSLVYVGNLGQGRWQSLVDLCEAAKTLRAEGHKVMVAAYAWTAPPEAVNVLMHIPNLQIFQPPVHDLVPAYLKGADVLLLPETLDAAIADEIRLSISTKSHLYMMSERPILVYGSPVAGVVEYAKREQWALVVEERNQQLLTAALRNLITDSDLRHSLIRRGVEVASKNHDETAVRRRLLQAFQDMVITKSPQLGAKKMKAKELVLDKISSAIHERTMQETPNRVKG